MLQEEWDKTSDGEKIVSIMNIIADDYLRDDLKNIYNEVDIDTKFQMLASMLKASPYYRSFTD
jgi:vacuolar-type H+-ATPase catalytic subunit A/Vma1